MAAQVVLEGVNASEVTTPGTLFAGKTFFLLRSTPLRSTFMDKITSNGGTVLATEGAADIKIADHARPKFATPGCISWTFVDACIKEGKLVSTQPHVIHPLNESRAVGSVTQAAKRLRMPFTAEDDRILVEWISKCEGDLKGNIIYFDLETKHPQHSWQSWRDRYVKGRAAGLPLDHLAGLSPQKNRSSRGQRQGDQMEQPNNAHDASLRVLRSEDPSRQGGDGIQKPASPDSEKRLQNESPVPRAAATPPAQYPTLDGHKSSVAPQSVRNARSTSHHAGSEATGDEIEDATADESEEENSEWSSTGADERYKVPFTESEFKMLLSGSKAIINVDPDRIQEAWAAFATPESRHTSEEWRLYWETQVKPVYLDQKAQRQRDGVPSEDDESYDEVEAKVQDRDEAKEEEDEEGNEDEQTEDAIVKMERGVTPEGVVEEAEGIEILADDGQRHLSTPIRLKPSPSQKRKQTGAAREQLSPSLLRSPLKRRRLDSAASESEQEHDSTMQEDTDPDESATQADAAYHTARTGESYPKNESLDLRADTDGESDDESADESEQFETARPFIKQEAKHALNSEQSVTQGYIDAQIQFEMSSAAERDRSAGSEQGPTPSKSLESGESASFILDDESEESPDEEEISESPGDSESEESEEESESQEAEGSTPSSEIGARPQQKPFAPAAFRSSPGTEPASKPSLLPAFASSPTPKQPQSNGKSLPRANQNANGNPTEATASQSSALEDVFEAAIPAWREAQLAAGVPAEHVLTAVKAASGELDLAELVIRALAQGKKVPTHIPGIWTDDDDWAIESGGDMMWGNMVRKHGPGIPEERREFLRAWNDSETEPEPAD